MTRLEQETTVTFNAADSHAMVWTCYSRTQTTLKKRGFTPERKEGRGYWFKIPKKCISFRSIYKKMPSDSKRWLNLQPHKGNSIKKAVQAKDSKSIL